VTEHDKNRPDQLRDHMTTSPAPRTRSAAARIAEGIRRIDTARDYRRVCSMARGAKFDHAEPIGPDDSGERFELNYTESAPRQTAADEAYAAYVTGCACDLTDHRHTAECSARWDAAAEAAEVEQDAPVFEVGQRVRFTADIGSPELVHVTGVIAEVGPRESVVTLDAKVLGYSPELRSFNRYIEPVPEVDPTELTAVEAVRLVTRRSQAITADKAERATRRRVEHGRLYRAELRAYGVPVAQLLYPEPAGPITPEVAAWLGIGPAEVPTKAQLEAAEYAAALRTLADIVEATPEVHRYNDFYAWYGGSRGDLAAVTRAALAAGATVAKDIDETSYNVELRIGPLKVSALASRRNVCERVVLGTDEVTRTVPDPAYVAEPVPTIEVTETVERIEWRCTPLLAEGGE
jgi:hypothetical protein